MGLYDLPAGVGAPAAVNVIVEIPKGTRNKIEFDPSEGVFRLDRVLYTPMQYPGDYGFIPSTLSPDGDALDVVVLVTEPTFTGCVLSVRVVGVLEMRDEAGIDQKVLAVPERDPRFAETRDIGHLPQHILKELEYFFEVYKDLEGKQTAILGWQSAETAYRIVTDAIEAYDAKRRGTRP